MPTVAENPYFNYSLRIGFVIKTLEVLVFELKKYAETPEQSPLLKTPSKPFHFVMDLRFDSKKNVQSTQKSACNEMEGRAET